MSVQSSTAVPSGASQPRVAWIDTARGLAILLVVLIHSVDWIQETTIRIPFWDDVNEVLSTLRMPLFFVCAGILAAKWMSASWPDLLSRKVAFLVWVYLIWQPIGSLAAIVASRFTGDELSLVRMIGSLALTPVRPRFEFWFLWALAVFFVMARLFVRLPRAPHFAVAAVVSALWFSSLVPETNLGWDGVAKYYLFFLIGCHYRSDLMTFAENVGFRTTLLLIGGWLALAVGTYVTGLDEWTGVGLVVRLVALAAGIALALRLHRLSLLTYLGSRTLPIYVAHTTVIIVLTWVVSHATGIAGTAVVAGVLPLIFVAVSVYACLILHSSVRNTPARVLYEPPPAVIDGLHRRLTASSSGATARVSTTRAPSSKAPSSRRSSSRSDVGSGSGVQHLNDLLDRR
jgi:uncharacterized membrane protein YcfT